MTQSAAPTGASGTVTTSSYCLSAKPPAVSCVWSGASIDLRQLSVSCGSRVDGTRCCHRLANLWHGHDHLCLSATTCGRLRVVVRLRRSGCASCLSVVARSGSVAPPTGASWHGHDHQPVAVGNHLQSVACGHQVRQSVAPAVWLCQRVDDTVTATDWRLWHGHDHQRCCGNHLRSVARVGQCVDRLRAVCRCGSKLGNTVTAATDWRLWRSHDHQRACRQPACGELRVAVSASVSCASCLSVVLK
jgi:hypothetical protein